MVAVLLKNSIVKWQPWADEFYTKSDVTENTGDGGAEDSETRRIHEDLCGGRPAGDPNHREVLGRNSEGSRVHWWENCKYGRWPQSTFSWQAVALGVNSSCFRAVWVFHVLSAPPILPSPLTPYFHASLHLQFAQRLWVVLCAWLVDGNHTSLTLCTVSTVTSASLCGEGLSREIVVVGLEVKSPILTSLKQGRL